jgi:hypothetical protein
MSGRLAELAARRAELMAASEALRERCATLAQPLAGAAAALDGARGLVARLRRVPLRLIVGLARSGLGQALSTEDRRATVIAHVATGVAALVRRWRRRKHRRLELEAREETAT